MAQITVVVPVFNKVELTRVCLESLMKGAVWPQRLIVIDNNSTDTTQDYLAKLVKNPPSKDWKIQVVKNNINKGCGAAFNQGIEMAETHYVGLLNNDTWIMPGWDKALIEAFQKINGDMLAPHYDEKPFDPDLTSKKAKVFIKKNKGKWTKKWGSVFMLFRRDVFEKIGKFDERFFLCFEDRDLRERMDRASMSYAMTADCFIWHKSQGTRSQIASTHNYEKESLDKFIEKWGFDPRDGEKKTRHKLSLKINRLKNYFGRF